MQAFLLASPRNHLLAQILLAGGLFWFFLLVAPEGLGVLSRFRVGLAELEGIRWLLQLACPVFLVLMVTQVKNLLFPRALGIFGLMVAAPLLSAAFPSGASDQAPYSHLVLHRHFPFDSLDRQALPVPRHGQ